MLSLVQPVHTLRHCVCVLVFAYLFVLLCAPCVCCMCVLCVYVCMCAWMHVCINVCLVCHVFVCVSVCSSVLVNLRKSAYALWAADATLNMRCYRQEHLKIHGRVCALASAIHVNVYAVHTRLYVYLMFKAGELLCIQSYKIRVHGSGQPHAFMHKPCQH